jgi:hypothetical protein
VKATRWLRLSAALVSTSCVVTTHEGPGEPPRVVAPPPPTSSDGPPPSANSDFGGEPETAQPQQAAEPGTAQSIAASHLLVQYQGSKRAPPNITRSKEEALRRAQEALAKVRAGADFAEVVAQYSDEPGAAERGGSLGRFTRERMVKEFADAAFALKPGEVSDVVETPFGFHVIKRTE